MHLWSGRAAAQATNRSGTWARQKNQTHGHFLGGPLFSTSLRPQEAIALTAPSGFAWRRWGRKRAILRVNCTRDQQANLA